MKTIENYFEEVGNKWNKRNDVVAWGQNDVKKIFSTLITRKFKTLKDLWRRENRPLTRQKFGSK